MNRYGSLRKSQFKSIQWRKPGAEFGGTKNFFADQDDVFSEKIPILAAKFLMTFF